MANTEQKHVEIFVKPGCPYCMALKRKLAEDRTPYVEHDVYEDPAALKRMLSLNGNRRNVPTAVDGGKVTVGYHGM